jgi:hypothetical protein
MKSNVILNSPSRELFGINIRQETKTGFLNLSDLQEAYLRARVLHGWSDKEVQQIIQQKENFERVYYILYETKIINLDFNRFMQNAENIGILKYFKQIQVYKTTGRGANKTTWCEPYIWTLIAMELNPMLYARVVIFLTDKLIVNRIEAGNFYKGLSRAITKFQDVDYVKLAKALNYKIFGRHETGIRNTATKEQLEKLYQLEHNLTFSIDMGFVNSFNECINLLNKNITTV